MSQRAMPWSVSTVVLISQHSGARADLAPQVSVSGLLHVVDGLTLQDTGRFLRYDESEVPW